LTGKPGAAQLLALFSCEPDPDGYFLTPLKILGPDVIKNGRMILDRLKAQAFMGRFLPN
jgi:hypothetical protein